MVTAPLITPSVIDLPSVGKAAKQPDQVIQIIIGKDDAIEMKIKEKTTSSSLKTIASTVLKAQADATSSAVVISADKNIKYETVVKVMDALQRAGVQRVGLSVQLAN
jgi:biopolymer transport protein TolR